MHWVELVTLLAVIQSVVFAVNVGRARVQFKVEAPATTGHPVFERRFRVHMNTLELLIVFLPALWVAARHWPPAWMAGIGAIYLVGRQIYSSGYVADPHKRGFGHLLSILPTVVLLVAGLVGIVRGIANGAATG